MYSSEQCRLKAEELERISSVLRTKDERAQYLEIARHWRTLQVQAAGFERANRSDKA